MRTTAPSRDELLSIDEVAANFNMGRSSVWLLIKQHGIERFKIPGQGRNTFVRRTDIERARNTGVPRIKSGDAD